MNLLIKDTTREEREEILRRSLNCGDGGCENCPSCSLGAGDPYEMYRDCIKGRQELAEINAAYRATYQRG